MCAVVVRRGVWTPRHPPSRETNPPASPYRNFEFGAQVWLVCWSGRFVWSAMREGVAGGSVGGRGWGDEWGLVWPGASRIWDGESELEE